jgi:hypothetical protein
MDDIIGHVFECGDIRQKGSYYEDRLIVLLLR